VIVAHHGAELIPLVAALGGAGAAPVLLVVCRARLGRFLEKMRRH
jgi:hypothetical protein